jgi:hypothetical protein
MYVVRDCINKLKALNIHSEKCAYIFQMNLNIAFSEQEIYSAFLIVRISCRCASVSSENHSHFFWSTNCSNSLVDVHLNTNCHYS